MSANLTHPPHAPNWVKWHIVARQGQVAEITSETFTYQNRWGCIATRQQLPDDVVIGKAWYPADAHAVAVLYCWFESYPEAFRHVLRGELKAAGRFVKPRAEAEFWCWAMFGSKQAMQHYIAKAFAQASGIITN